MDARLIARMLGGAGLSLLLVGCATTSRHPAGSAPPPVFYPSDPEDARLQFLTSLFRPEDIIPEQSALLTFLSGPREPKSPITKPYGIASAPGKLYVVDTIASLVHVVDLQKRTWTYFEPQAPGGLRKCIGVAVDGDGTFYVTDTTRGQILIYDAAGNFMGTLGKGQEYKPVDVKISGDKLYVADLKTASVLIFDKQSRKLLFTMPREPKNDQTRLYAPVGVAIDSKGCVYVSDAGAFHVQHYDPEGNLLKTIGQQGDSVGDFARNKGLVVDRHDNLYVVDAAYQNVQIFNDEGKVLLYFADSQTSVKGCLELPASICIDYENVDLFKKYVAPGFEIEYLVYVTSQMGDHKVSVYGFLKRPDEKGN